jgi:hypothetical protein
MTYQAQVSDNVFYSAPDRLQVLCPLGLSLSSFPPQVPADHSSQNWPALPSFLGSLPKGKRLRPISSDCSDSDFLQCSRIVTDGCLLRFLHSQNLDCAVRLTEGLPNRRELLLDLLFLLVSGDSWTEKVLVRLAAAEQAEIDVWLRDDIRIAWLTCLYAARGYAEPHVAATYQVLGIHPSKVFGAIIARRKALLGTVRDDASLPPKKSPQSVGRDQRKRKEG